jgi:hypothetical protein
MRTITITHPEKSNRISAEPAIWQISEQDILIDAGYLPLGFAGDELSLAILEWDKSGRLFRDRAYARETLMKEATGQELKEALGYIQDRRTLPVKEYPFKRITSIETPYQVGDKVRVINSKQVRHIMTLSTNQDGFHSYEMMEAPYGRHTQFWHHELELLQ